MKSKSNPILIIAIVLMVVILFNQSGFLKLSGPNPVAYFTFDNKLLDINNSMSFKYNPYLSSELPISYVDGVKGQAVRFQKNGYTPSWYSLPKNQAFNITGDMTISLWIYPYHWTNESDVGGVGSKTDDLILSSSTNNQVGTYAQYRIYRRGNWSGNVLYYAIAVSKDYFNTTLNNDLPNYLDGKNTWAGTVTVDSINPIPEKRWTQIIIRKSANRISFWVNGAKVNEYPINFGDNKVGDIVTSYFSNLTIGNCNCAIDELKIYNYAVADQSLKLDFNSTIVPASMCGQLENVPCGNGTFKGVCRYNKCMAPKQCDYNYQCEDSNSCTTDECGLYGVCKHSTISSTTCDTKKNNWWLYLIVGGVLLVFVLFSSKKRVI